MATEVPNVRPYRTPDDPRPGGWRVCAADRRKATVEPTLPLMALSRGRDLVVVGASAGGVEALTDLVRNLPGDLAAAVLVVLHVPPTSSSRLTEVLDRAGPLHAVTAAHGGVAERGRLYVAPPDRHMIVSGRRIFLLDGPRENGVRPAVDPLFRSAAATAGRRVIGIVLSGTLDDGAAGMAAIQAFGGATVVQDPADALSDGMPQAVLELIRPDVVVPASAMGPIIARLVAGEGTERERRIEAGEGAAELGPRADEFLPADLKDEVASRRAALIADPATLPPTVADIACPDCGGSLAEVAVGPISRYRCRVGHVYSPEALFGMKTTELEAGLWAALRTLEESASVAKRLADRSRANGSTTMTRRFQRRQSDAAERADLVRQALQSLTELTEIGEPREEVTPAAPSHTAGGRATTPG